MPKTKDTITLVVHQKAVRGQSPAIYVVQRDHCPIGWLEKYQNTHYETHPWKAFDYRRQYLGAFYENGSVPDDGDTQFGGKAAALRAITC